MCIFIAHLWYVETVVKMSLKTNQPKIGVAMKTNEESNCTPEERATYQKIKDTLKYFGLIKSFLMI